MIFCKVRTAVYATYRSWLWASCLFESCSGDTGCSCACGGCYTGCCYSPSGGSRFGVGSERQEEAYGQGEEGIGIGISNISGIRDGLGAFFEGEHVQPGERLEEDGDGVDDDDDARSKETVVAEGGQGGVLVQDSGVRKDGEICARYSLCFG